jgi:hypothetical protein
VPGPGSLQLCMEKIRVIDKGLTPKSQQYQAFLITGIGRYRTYSYMFGNSCLDTGVDQNGITAHTMRIFFNIRDIQLVDASFKSCSGDCSASA